MPAGGSPADPRPLFPYAPRPHQRELVRFLQRALEQGGHSVAESGTGTGKTVCALSAALPAARASGKRVLYLTRTNSQARQVILESRAIRRASGGAGGVAVALQGRQHLCPLRRQDDEMAKADAEELGLMCRDRMKSAEEERGGGSPRIKGCPFYAAMLERGSQHLVQWARDELPDAEELAAAVERDGQCPHLVTRQLLQEAELVVAPYVYFFQPALRGAFLRWMGVAPSDLLVVVDEAHNLPDYARELATPRLSRRTLALAQKEAQRFGDPNVLPDASLTRFLSVLERVMEEIRDAFVPDQEEDALVPPDEFDVLLLSGLRASTTGLMRALALMDEYAEAVRQARRREGKVPRSHVGSVSAFLRAYRGLDLETHAPIVEVDKGEPRLVAFALDPSVVTGALHETGGSLHVSGTLHPLEEYRDSVGLDPRRTRLARFPSPFPPENRLVLVDDEVTTRHEDVAREPGMWHAIGERLVDLRRATDRNMAVFLPSHDVLHRLAPYLRSTPSYVERRELRHDELMAQVHAFKAGRGGTLVSVIGGRLSEGIDFPDAELEVVVIVGLPYARPSAKGEALVRFYDRRFGRGWEWAVKVPMQRKLLQAAGRLIRTPTDRGVVVLLDRRAAALRDALGGAERTSDPAQETWRFFQSQE